MIELKGKYCKDCVIFSDNLDEDTLSTIYSVLDNPAFENQTIRIMPDVHNGNGIVIGFVSTIGDYVCPAHVGSDIGCSISAIMFNGTMNPEDYPLFDHRVRENIMFGFDLQKKRIFDMKDFFKFVKKAYSSACGAWPEMIEYPDAVNEKWLSSVLKRVSIDEATFYKGIGSVGGSNHFCELSNVCDKDGNLLGKTAFTLHTGSRNFGTKVFKYWDSIAKKHIVNNCPQGYLTGDLLKQYLSDMVLCQAYAIYNHNIIHSIITKIMLKFNLKDETTLICSHNYINPYDKIVRKGSISAKLGETVIVPFNMKDGTIIGTGKGNKHWLSSCSHGAGRKFSRSKAKKEITLSDFENIMKDVFSTSVNANNIDEAPQAYKDAEVIKELISDTIDISYVLKPVINIKSKKNGE